MKKIPWICYVVMLLCQGVTAQSLPEDTIRTTHFPEMRFLQNSPIPGTPILSQPERINGTLMEIRTEKQGLIYPAFFDWNEDGKKDLLLGEFEIGYTGSFIKIYLNEGTDKEPRFSGNYFYATDINGDTITNYQFCCIGIHPRIFDLDGDGYPDILSGQYNPGQISWWRGSEKGFLPRVFVDQEYFVEGKRYLDFNTLSPESNTYWNYTTVDFADFNGDGLPDLFVGGSAGLRVALNTGTRENPKFGIRQHLFHTDGSALSANREKAEKPGDRPFVWKTYLTPVDWDSDGILDILLTHEYVKTGHHAIEFFKGVQTAEGLRFEKPIPLFTEREGRKALPGCQPMITVVDYNNDGINDIVFGLSIPTVNGFEVAEVAAWGWTHELELSMPGHDPALMLDHWGGVEAVAKKINEDPTKYKSFYIGKLDDLKYLTLRHRGYLFVMYGSERPRKEGSFSVKIAPATHETTPAPATNPTEMEEEEKPISFEIKLPEKIKPGKKYVAEVVLSFGKGWHGYVDSESIRALGFIPTTVEFIFPEGVRKTADMIRPETSISGGYPVYQGKNVVFRQEFVCTAKILKQLGNITVKAHIQHQICDENMCLPPDEITIEKTASGV